MLLGGIPGVIVGSLIFGHVAHHGPKALLYIVLGSIIIFSSGWRGVAGARRHHQTDD